MFGRTRHEFVRNEGGKLIYTHCCVITSHALGGCAVQTAGVMWHMEEVTPQQERCNLQVYNALQIRLVARRCECT